MTEKNSTNSTTPSVPPAHNSEVLPTFSTQPKPRPTAAATLSNIIAQTKARLQPEMTLSQQKELALLLKLILKYDQQYKNQPTAQKQTSSKSHLKELQNTLEAMQDLLNYENLNRSFFQTEAGSDLTQEIEEFANQQREEIQILLEQNEDFQQHQTPEESQNPNANQAPSQQPASDEQPEPPKETIKQKRKKHRLLERAAKEETEFEGIKPLSTTPQPKA